MMNNTATLTADQIALDAFIKAENDAFEARCRAEGATCWGVFALTAKELAEEHFVFNIPQFLSWREEVDAQERAKEIRRGNY